MKTFVLIQVSAYLPDCSTLTTYNKFCMTTKENDINVSPEPVDSAESNTAADLTNPSKSLSDRVMKEFKAADEFLDQAQEEQTEASVPRRWKVRLWNFSVQSIKADSFPCFVNIAWGGNVREYPLEPEKSIFNCISKPSPTIWKLGVDSESFRTPIFEPSTKETVQLEGTEFTFEWRGSYNDLNTQLLTVELWKWSSISANKKHSTNTMGLKEIASGPVFLKIPLFLINQDSDAPVKKDISESCFIVNLQVYFQEIYDFILVFSHIKARGLQSAYQLKNSSNDKSDNSDSDESEGLEGDSEESVGSDNDKDGLQVSMRNDLDDKRDIAAVKSLGKTPDRIQRKGLTITLLNESSSEKGRLSFLAPVQVIRSEYRRSVPYRWTNIGKIHYQGSMADLDNDFIRVDFFEKSGGAFTRRIPIGSTRVSLRGIYDYGFLSGKLNPPKWIKADLNECGNFNGRVIIEHLPQTRQSGDFCDMTTGGRYLLISINKIDKLCTPDQRPTSQCDSFVTGQFAGSLFSTSVIKDSLSPEFKQEFYFELPGKDEFYSPHQASKAGSISLDVWLDPSDSRGCDHCGSAEISILEILRDGKREVRAHQSIRTGQVEEYETVVLRVRKLLHCYWQKPGVDIEPSYIYLEAWVKPIINLAPGKESVTSSNSGVPRRLIGEWEKRVRLWEQVTEPLKSQIPGTRQFLYQALSQRYVDRMIYIPTFLDTIRPPEAIANRYAIAYWIRCLTSSRSQMSSSGSLWFSPDFTLMTQKGDEVSRSVLHACLLLGCSRNFFSKRDDNEKAFVCLGTSWEGKQTAWVLTFDEDASVTLWDSVEHKRFVLPSRFADEGRASRVLRGQRRVGRNVNKDLVNLEVLRRKNMLASKDWNRSPENIEIFDDELHFHCLEYSSEIDKKMVCELCQEKVDGKISAGYVCNGRIRSEETEDGTEDLESMQEEPCSGVFFCIKCTQLCFTDKIEDDELYIGKCVRPQIFSNSPVLPWRSIEVVFNNVNCWANLQNPNPLCIYYDFWNPLYWHAFASANSSELRPFFSVSRGLRRAKPQGWYDSLQLTVNENLKKSIEVLRKQANVSTTLQRDPTLLEFIELGLEQRAELELIPLSKREAAYEAFADWRRALYSKIPDGCRFVGKTVHFNTVDFELTKKQLLEKCPFVTSKEVGAQFCFSAYIHALPGSVISCFAYIGLLYSLNRTQAEEYIQEKIPFTQDGEPLDLLTDEFLEDQRIRETYDGDLFAHLKNKQSNQEAEESGETVKIPSKENRRASVRSTRESVRRNTNLNRPVKYEGKVSDYIKSLTDGGTQLVSRVVKTKEIQEKRYFLHHKSGQEFSVPSPAEMRELRALGTPGLADIAFSRAVKQKVVIDKT